MKLTFIYPDHSQLEAFLAVRGYEDIWKEYSEQIQQTLHDCTGLTFQQNEIQVTVHNEESMPGTDTKPMRLNARNATPGKKRIGLLYALCYRFLNGNGLLTQGDSPEEEAEDDRRVYLLLGEALYGLYGKELFDEWSKLDPDQYSEHHLQVLRYVLGLTRQQRLQKLKILADTGKLE